jgi:HSP20 family protein
MLRRPSSAGSGYRRFLTDFEQMQRNLDKLFATSVAVSPAGTPAIEFFKGEEGFLVRANVPGIAPENLEITLLGKKLTLKGSYEYRVNDEATGLIQERESGSFNRTLSLPQEIDTDEVVATFKNGVVEIILPLAISEQPRRIEIGLHQRGES